MANFLGRFKVKRLKFHEISKFGNEVKRNPKSVEEML
jgi:hypothetical protein